MKTEIIVGTDFKGQRLCVNCWDGAHFYKYGEPITEVGKSPKIPQIVCDGPESAKVFRNCLEGGCECQCRNLKSDRYSQAAKRGLTVKREKEAQQSLCEKPALARVDEKKESAVGL